jgi:hypothetical protein
MGVRWKVEIPESPRLFTGRFPVAFRRVATKVSEKLGNASQTRVRADGKSTATAVTINQKLAGCASIDAVLATFDQYRRNPNFNAVNLSTSIHKLSTLVPKGTRELPGTPNVYEFLADVNKALSLPHVKATMTPRCVSLMLVAYSYIARPHPALLKSLCHLTSKFVGAFDAQVPRAWV